MNEEGVDHKLATIPASVVVGNSWLTVADVAGTFWHTLMSAAITYSTRT